MKSKVREMHECLFSRSIVYLCRWRILRKIFIPFVLKVEGGEWYSLTWRKILVLYFGQTVGDYSYGKGFANGGFPAGIKVGRYVSIGPEVKIFLRNHPIERLSMHPFFYNKNFAYVSNDNIPGSSLSIKDDVWIGGHVIITPGCRDIGVGAVIGAGAVVTKDVPAFAIVVGNPATVKSYRFDDEDRKRILESRWWKKSISELSTRMDAMVVPFNSLSHTDSLLQNSDGRDMERFK